jgi:hypothetical protein
LKQGGYAFAALWPSLLPAPRIYAFTSQPSFDHVLDGAHNVTVAVEVRGAHREVAVCVADKYYATSVSAERTVLSLHLEDSIADAGVVNPKTVAATGTAALSTAFKPYGKASLECLNVGSNINGLVVTDHPDFDFGTLPFGFDGWAYRLSDATDGILFRYTGSGGQQLSVVVSAGQVRLYYASSAGTLVNLASGVLFPLNTWQYFVLQRRGGNFYFWLGSQQPHTVPVPGLSAASVPSEGPLYVGRQGVASTNAWNGYIKSFRVLKGAVRRPHKCFDVPRGPISADLTVNPSYANTKLLLAAAGVPGAASVIDAGPLGLTPASVGSVTVSSDTAPYGGTSLRFPVGGSPIRYTGASLFDLSSGDWTIRCWFHKVPGGANSIVSRRATLSATGWCLTTSNFRANINGSYSDIQMLWDENSLGVWRHLALVKLGSVLLVFLDGEIVATRLGVSTIQDLPAVDLYIGQADAGTENRFGGYMKDFEFIRGIGLYSAAFSPPRFGNCDGP